MAQTSVIGWRKRRITPREAARLQGLPDWFDFGNQSDAVTYKQLGNGVAVGAVYHVFREHVRRDGEDLPLEIVDPVLSAGKMPKPPRPKKFVKP
jgi:DNA (cytosine-5)-methyltransferase 1